jgi:3-dehydroquinate synthase
LENKSSIAKGEFSLRTIHVETGIPYDIFIERGIIDHCGEYVKRLSTADKVTVITDSNVATHYQWRVRNSLEEQGFKVNTHIFPAGEESKTLDSIADMYSSLADFGMTRKDIVVALGGGVTGDMAGFAAASYLRGIDFIQIPTSLLAQVDSSVGGKTGVDIAQGKNLVGAFHQPKAVLIDPDTLDTLPDLYLRDGMAEVIKYGCIKDAAFFENLESENAFDHIEDVIETCVSIKRDVVSRDEREAGERMLLNFGHTLGHSIEKLYDFKGISHGMAVAIGMVLISKASEKACITEQGTSDRIVAICEKYGLPTSDKATFADMAKAAQSDKKTAGGSINLVLLNKIGDSFTKKVALENLEDFITV